MSGSDKTIADNPSAHSHDVGATLAGDGTLDTNPDENGDATLAGDDVAAGRADLDDRTLAGEGTFADEPEGTVDNEGTVFDAAAAGDDDRTLGGEPADGDRTLMNDPTLEIDRTLAEDSPRKRRRSPIEDDTFDDPTLAGDGGSPRGEADERTLMGDDSPGDDFADSDRTVMDSPGSNRVDADATIMGDDSPRPDDDDRTMVGDDPAPRGAAGDRTMPGDDPDATADGSADTRPAARTPLEPVKNYDLIEDFARGGMGKIWRAMDLRIRREVAYKELLPNALKNPIVVERFLKEAQVTGQLEHPGIVPIYDLGWQENGTPFYSMKLVRGSTFKKPIEEYHALPRNSSERRLAFVKVLQQFVAICNTLGYSHERGVLHRDLKPLNIMVGDFGETLVLDWGLARLINDPDNSTMGDETITYDEGLAGIDGTSALDGGTPRGADVTQDSAPNRGATHSGGTHSGGTQHGSSQGGHTSGGTRRQSIVTDYASEGSATVMGSVMGTPAYMPPEQARGLHNQLDGRADIYALGAIFYEILTNRAPIPKGKLPEMLRMVVEGKIEPPRKIDPTIPRPLEAVCMKALAKEKTDRYATSLELAREIERYLADEPVQAFPEPWYTRAGRWMRRHRTLVTTTVGIVIFGLIGLSAYGAIESRRVAGIERSARERIAKAKESIQAAVSIADLESAGSPLTEAAGLVASEPKLASLQTEIRNDIDDLSRDVASRKESLRSQAREEANKAVSDSERMVAAGQLNEAIRLLTEGQGKLNPWPELTELSKDLQSRTAAIRQQVEQRDAKVAAQDKFTHFLAEVDQARFFGSLFSTASAAEHTKSAHERAVAALTQYGLDKADAPVPKPELLSAAQQKQLVENAFEALLILADTEINLAGDATPETRKEGAEKALAWLERAKPLGVVARVLPYREALAHDRMGDAAKRDERLGVAFKIKPTTALDFYLLGQEKRYDGKFDDALQLYQQALQVDPQYFWALQSIGLCHLRTGHPEAAVAAYTAAIASRPDTPICYLTRAIAFGDLNQENAALADLRKAEELKADPYELLLNRGGILFQFSHFDESIAAFEEASRLLPEQPGPYRNIGSALRVQADGMLKTVGIERAKPVFERSLTALSTAIEKSPNDAVAHSLRGDVLVRLGRDDEAIADFEAAARLAMQPDDRAKAFAEIGKIHHRADKPRDALPAYNRSLAANKPEYDEKELAAKNKLTPNKQRSDVYRLRAEVLNKLGELEKADADWSLSLKLGEPIGDIYRGRALSRAARGKYRDAMNDYTRSLELEPSPNMLTRRGWAYLLKANQLALDDFTEAIAQNPENPDSYNGRGYARVMLGDYVAAAADAEEALKKERAAEKKNADWQNVYNAATIFAQAVDRIEKDTTKSDEEREKLVAEMTLRSLKTLGETVKAAGTKNQAILLQTIKADTALDPIRQRPEFLKIFGPKKPE